MELIVPPVEPEQEPLSHRIGVGQSQRRGRERGRGAPCRRAPRIEEVDAACPSYSSKERSEDDDGYTTGSPGHVLWKLSGDHDTSIVAIEPGEAAAPTALPVVVVDSGRAGAARCPQDPSVPDHDGGPEAKLHLP